MTTETTLLYQTAIAYLAAGLSILPIQWAEKRPAGYLLPQVDGRATWNPYRVRLATACEARRWFTGGADALAIVTGPISGGLEALDFDAPDLYAPWVALIQSQATILDGLPVVQSRSGGYHVYYRCAEPAGNQKLAEDPARAKRTLIETRGTGGYLVAPPSRAYTLLQGDLTAIPLLSEDERALLLDAARTFDQVPPRPAPRPSPACLLGSESRPGDDFNRHGDVAALLESHGWRLVYQRGDESYWCRPGKAHGVSATLNYRGQGGLYVFSSNAAPFDPGRAYSPFAVLALLEYGGDFRAAARALRAQGYGEVARGR